MNEIRCSQCGSVGLEHGFLTDTEQGGRGYAQWIAGVLKLGAFGSAKTRGRRRETVYAFRCPQCGHVELFAHS